MKIRKFDTAILAIIFSSILICLTVSIAQQNSLFKQIPDEIKKYNFYKRWEWFMAPRIFPLDTISIHTYHRELNKESSYQHQILMKTSQSPLLTLPDWNHLGPASVVSHYPSGDVLHGGRVRAIAVHPTDPLTVYIGAASGGLWKSTDGGMNWHDLNTEFTSNNFGAIAIDPNNPDVIYAGTGEAVADWRYNIYDGRGLFKSSDAGKSWTIITDGFGLSTHFGALTISPHNSNIVFAGIGVGYIYAENLIDNRGLWRSEDAGLSWKRTLALKHPGRNAAYDIVVHPFDSSIVYAAIGGFNPYDECGFYISNDNGRTWTKSNSGLPMERGHYYIERMQIAVANSLPSTIYAAVFNNAPDPYKTKVYKSTDDGKTWSRIAADKEFGGSGSDQGSYDLCIAVDPADANHVLVGNIELSRSRDGQNFSYVDGNMHVDYHKIVFAPSNNATIYIGNDGGIYQSTDGGTAWQHRNKGLATLQFYSMSSHPIDKNTIFAGSQDNFAVKTRNHGVTPWEIIGVGGDVQGILFDHLNPAIVYAVAYRRNLYKSTDGGVRFNSLTIDFDTRYDFNSLGKTLLIHPSNNQWLYAGSKKVWRSTNGGNNWTALIGELSAWPIETMAQSHVNPDIMILASMAVMQTNSQVMVSTDGGLHWTNVTAHIPDAPRPISRVVTHPVDANTLFVVRSGYGSGKIYRSLDLGATWTNITSNLPDIPHSDLFIDPTNPSLYFIANDFGVYGSQDAGQSWTRLGNGMPFVVATDLDYFNHDGERLLRVATYGRGVYETDLNQIPDWTAPQIKLTAPKPGEKIMAGVPDTIRWNVSDNSAIFSIEIQYSLNNGTTWNPFPAVQLNVNELIWETPLINSRFCSIRAQAKDAEGNQGENRVGPFTINRPPIIIQPQDTTILEDEPFAMKLWVEQVDPGDTITYFDNCAFLEVNQTSGEISFTPTNDRVGKHLILLWAFDGVGADTTQFRLNIENVNDAPEPFQLISPASLTTINTLNPTLQWTEANDVDSGDSLYYRLWLAEDSTFSLIIRDEKLTTTKLVIDSGLVCNRRYFWQVFAIDRDSAVTACSKIFSFQTSATATGITINAAILPTEFQLQQNHPNPFNSTTIISYAVAKKSHVKITVYNTLGQLVAVLVNGTRAQGAYSITWDAQHQPSGLYICRLEADGFTAKMKMFLQK